MLCNIYLIIRYCVTSCEFIYSLGVITEDKNNSIPLDTKLEFLYVGHKWQEIIKRRNLQ